LFDIAVDPFFSIYSFYFFFVHTIILDMTTSNLCFWQMFFLFSPKLKKMTVIVITLWYAWNKFEKEVHWLYVRKWPYSLTHKILKENWESLFTYALDWAKPTFFFHWKGVFVFLWMLELLYNICNENMWWYHINHSIREFYKWMHFQPAMAQIDQGHKYKSISKYHQ